MKNTAKCANCNSTLKENTYFCPYCNNINEHNLPRIKYNSSLFDIISEKFIMDNFVNISWALKNEANKIESKYKTAHGVLETEIMILAFFMYKTLFEIFEDRTQIEDKSFFTFCKKSFIDLIKDYSRIKVSELIDINSFEINIVFNTRLKYYKKILKKFAEKKFNFETDGKVTLIKLASSVFHVIKADEIALEKRAKPFANEDEIQKSEIYTRQNNYKTYGNLDEIQETDLPLLNFIVNLCNSFVLYLLGTAYDISHKIKEKRDKREKALQQCMANKYQEISISPEELARLANDSSKITDSVDDEDCTSNTDKAENKELKNKDDSTSIHIIISSIIILIVFLSTLFFWEEPNKSTSTNNYTLQTKLNTNSENKNFTNEDTNKDETNNNNSTNDTDVNNIGNINAADTEKIIKLEHFVHNHNKSNEKSDERQLALVEYYAYLYGFMNLDTDALTNYCHINGTVPREYIYKFKTKFSEIPIIQIKILKQLSTNKFIMLENTKKEIEDSWQKRHEEIFNEFNKAHYEIHGNYATKEDYCSQYNKLADKVLEIKMENYNNAKSVFSYLNIN